MAQMTNSMDNLFAVVLPCFLCVNSTNTSNNLDTMWSHILMSFSLSLILLYSTQSNSIIISIGKSDYTQVCYLFLTTSFFSSLLRNWLSNFHGNMKSVIPLLVINCQVLISLWKFNASFECLDKVPATVNILRIKYLF